MSFVIPKIVWAIVAPANLFALLLLLGGFWAISHDEGKQLRGRKMCFALAVLAFSVALFPVGRWMLLPLENRFPPERPEHVDGIILLAGDENPELTEARRQPVLGSTARRYVTFAALAREYPQARLAFIGGSNELMPTTELSNAAIGKRALTSMGISPERVTYEEKSRNTYENASFATEIIKPKRDQNWLLVTSAFHMPRALLCFRKDGWRIYPATTDYHSPGAFKTDVGFNLFDHLLGIELAMHEYFGIVEYWIMGRIDWPW